MRWVQYKTLLTKLAVSPKMAKAHLSINDFPFVKTFCEFAKIIPAGESCFAKTNLNDWAHRIDLINEGICAVSELKTSFVAISLLYQYLHHFSDIIQVFCVSHRENHTMWVSLMHPRTMPIPICDMQCTTTHCWSSSCLFMWHDIHTEQRNICDKSV